MLTTQLIDDYLQGHKIARKLEVKHMEMLRRIFFTLRCEDETDFFLKTSELVAYCNKELTDYSFPEPALARIANKALAMLITKPY